jgi:hypothetical protein
VKHHVDSIQRRLDDFSIAHVALYELSSVPNSRLQPGRLTIPVSLRFEVIENAN